MLGERAIFTAAIAALTCCTALYPLDDLHTRSSDAVGAGGTAIATATASTATSGPFESTATGIGMTGAGVTSGSTAISNAVATGSGGPSSVATSGSGGNNGCAHYVFVGTTQLDGTMNGLGVNGADQACQQEAPQGGPFKFLVWKAVLSTDQMSAKDRLGPLMGNVCLLDLQRTLVATQGSWWSTQHDAPIDVGPVGQPVAVGTLVWFSSFSDGKADVGFTCNSWSSNAGNIDSGTGSTADAGLQWAVAGPVACSSKQYLYCFGVPAQ